MKIVGSSKQEGTPKPDNPVQITNETVLIITDKEGNKKEMPFKYEKILKEGDKIEKINEEWCLVRRNPMNNIEILEKLQNIFKELRKDDEEGHSSAYELQWEDIEAIENLIQRNKELEMQNKEFLIRLKADGLIERDKYWINKIKEIIKLLDKEEKETLKGTKGQDRYSIKLEYMHKRNVLQELLEESDK